MLASDNPALHGKRLGISLDLERSREPFGIINLIALFTIDRDRKRGEKNFHATVDATIFHIAGRLNGENKFSSLLGGGKSFSSFN
jgi:hypothetical protein